MRYAPIALVFLLTVTLHAEPVVDDEALTKALTDGIIAFTKDDKGPTADSLATSVDKAPKTLAIALPEGAVETNPEDSIYIIATVYDCGKCDKWHLGGTASAWALTEDGIMVTNHHVLAEAEGAAIGVCDKNGKVHRVVEVLAADKQNDIAVFRVDAKGLKPLRIAPPAKIGDEIKVISHPDSLFFSHTFGRVSRYHKQPMGARSPGAVSMSITADFAIGSSGAPILDARNGVVGMVVSTRHIYYNAEAQENLQMVVKDCVPVAAIAEMFEKKKD
jgi:S1-C subfamily serine protease